MNKLILDNKNLKADIESLRKEKTGAQNVLDSITSKCNATELSLLNILRNNEYNLDETSKVPLRK